MTLPVILEPTSDNRVRAHSTVPMSVSAIGDDADEALRLWRLSFRETLPAGAKVVMVNPSETEDHPLANVAGLLKDHPLFNEWQQAIEEYRRQRDPDDNV